MEIRMIIFWNEISESCVTVRETHFSMQSKLNVTNNNYKNKFNWLKTQFNKKSAPQDLITRTLDVT